jgi:hypothetical protein
MRPLIGFTGLARCGKGTAAEHLVRNHGFACVKFAGALKDMMRALGLTEDHIEGHLKELPCDLLGGKTPRFAMQRLGTEFGRQTIADDIWIRAWCDRVSKVGPQYHGIVTDDTRFDNEAAAIRDAGGIVVRIIANRDGVGIAGAHASEAMAFSADVTIDNSGTIAEFITRVDDILMHA